MIDYSLFWEYMQKNNISQYYLIQHGIASKTIYNIKKNCYISTSTSEKLCKIMDCTPNDIIKFTDD